MELRKPDETWEIQEIGETLRTRETEEILPQIKKRLRNSPNGE